MLKIENTPTREILLIDDDAPFAYLVRLILDDICVPTRLWTVSTPEAAFNFLRKKGEFERMPTPDVCLLDYQLPRRDGLSVLREIRESEGLRYLPVVLMSGVDKADVIRQAYRDGANSYLIKPTGLDEIVRTFELLVQYWLRSVELP